MLHFIFCMHSETEKRYARSKVKIVVKLGLWYWLALGL